MATLPLLLSMEDANNDRPLPSYVQEVREAIQPHITATEDGLPADTARSRLQDEGFESATIDAAVEHLLLHGYLYEVDGRLRVPTKSR